MEPRNSITPFLAPDDLHQRDFTRQVTTQLASAQLVVQNGISWIFDLGIRPEMPFYLKKNLALINRVCLVSLLLALPGSFILLLAGFNHPFSLFVISTVVPCLILALNRARQARWAVAIFSFFPAITIASYALVDFNSGQLTNALAYILIRQGLCLSLLLPVIIYGFDKTRRGIILGLCMLIYIAFDVTSLGSSTHQLGINLEINTGLFSFLSLAQFAGLSACVLYMQAYTQRHEHQVILSNEKLRQLAIRDGMTGLFNHAFIEGLIVDAINRSKRSKGPLSLLMIDVDGFKEINDTWGHNAGDEVLVRLARLLQGSTRSTDYLGRWGGDELILLLTETNLQGASSLAEKLRTQVDKHIFMGKAHLTISLGACQYREGETLADFIRRADVNLYRAKRLGRNRAISI